jgi:hypothetical protein
LTVEYLQAQVVKDAQAFVMSLNHLIGQKWIAWLQISNSPTAMLKTPVFCAEIQGNRVD